MEIWNHHHSRVRVNPGGFKSTEQINRQEAVDLITSHSSIEFEVSDPGEVTLRIYDLSGEEIESLLESQHLPAGSHRVLFDPTRYRNAIHLYRLTLQTESRTIVEVKRLLTVV